MTIAQPPIAAVSRIWPLRIPMPVIVALIPAAFVIIGLVIRYFAYAASVPDETLAGFPLGMCRWDCG